MVRSISKNRIVRNLFTKLAIIYDALEIGTLGRRGQQWRRRAMAAAQLQKANRVMDGCSGTGQLTLQLAQQLGPQGHVVAVDFCPAMVQQAKQKFRAMHLHRRVEFKTENVEILPFPDDFFDAVFITFGLRFVSDIRTVLRECHRVLKKNAPLVIVELARPTNPFVRVYAHLYREYWLPLWCWYKFRLPRTMLYPLFDALAFYPDAEKMTRMMTRVGFERTRYEKLDGGIATLHIGRKHGDAVSVTEEEQPSFL